MIIIKSKPDYHKLSTLGSGTYGVVWQVENKLGDLFAMKEIEPSINNKITIINELYVASLPPHPHLPRIHEIYYFNQNVLIIMELLKSIDVQKEHLSQIQSGLRYLHLHQVYHGDLTPNNIMMGHDGMIKIIDFSLTFPLTVNCGIEVNQSIVNPEVFFGRIEDLKFIDTYSLGMFWYNSGLDDGEKIDLTVDGNINMISLYRDHIEFTRDKYRSSTLRKSLRDFFRDKRICRMFCQHKYRRLHYPFPTSPIKYTTPKLISISSLRDEKIWEKIDKSSKTIEHWKKEFYIYQINKITGVGRSITRHIYESLFVSWDYLDSIDFEDILPLLEVPGYRPAYIYYRNFSFLPHTKFTEKIFEYLVIASISDPISKNSFSHAYAVAILIAHMIGYIKLEKDRNNQILVRDVTQIDKRYLLRDFDKYPSTLSSMASRISEAHYAAMLIEEVSEKVCHCIPESWLKSIPRLSRKLK